MDLERKGLAITTYEGERTVDRRFRAMAKSIPAVVAGIAGEGEALKPFHHAAIMRRVDIELDVIFPAQLGGASVLEGDIQQMTNRARSRGVKAALDPIVRAIRRIDPELYRAISR